MGWTLSAPCPQGYLLVEGRHEVAVEVRVQEGYGYKLGMVDGLSRRARSKGMSPAVCGEYSGHAVYPPRPLLLLRHRSLAEAVFALVEKPRHIRPYVHPDGLRPLRPFEPVAYVNVHIDDTLHVRASTSPLVLPPLFPLLLYSVVASGRKICEIVSNGKSGPYDGCFGLFPCPQGAGRPEARAFTVRYVDEMRRIEFADIDYDKEATPITAI